MKIINKDQYQAGLKHCQKGKHKLRENAMGITWCVRCGLLSTALGAQKLEEIDIIYIKK